ncbi:MAG: CUB domain-containing protein, partial [Flavobacteriia bacterium]
MLKKLHCLLLLAVLSLGQLSIGQSIMTCPPVGTTNTLTQCGGQYADPGGNGNYANNLNCTQTICPSTAGQCVTLQFTGGQLETGWDYLYIYNGNTATGTPLATLNGTITPQNVTSTTGCLTLQFISDGSTVSTGWLANVICAPCGTPPPPPPGPVIASDCSGAVNICTNATFQIDPSGSGNVVEFTTGSIANPSTNVASANLGCLLSGELNSTWMIVNVATTGTLEFSFGAVGGTGCLDWIMWPYAGPATCTQIINNTLAPVRCNWNGFCETFTGLATPVPGLGDPTNFEPELNVICGQRYLICLSNYSSQTTSLPLNFFGTASISCTTVTPVTVNSASICAGQSATLTATGANTYTWTPATGLSATTGATVTASPTTTTTYTVTGVGSCGTTSANATVTVNAASATATNTGPYCIGSTIQLNGTGPAGATYAWTGPNGFTSAVQNPSLPATAAAAGTYTLTTTLGGCTATASTTVAVNPVATANANIDQTICAGGSVNLAGTVGGSATSGSWSAASGTFSNPTSLTSTYTPTITSGTITLTLTSNDPTGPCPAVTDQMIITVTPGPIVNAGPDQTLCSGPNVTLTATGATTYTWTPTVTNGVAFTPTIGTTTYTVVGTTAGCTGTDQVVVTVNQTPTIVANNVSVCATGTTSVTATGGNTYSWSPSTYLSAATGASVTFTPGVTTTYTVTGTSAAGCTGTDPVTVTVLANAPINAGLDVIICAGTQITLTASGGATYTWSPSAGLSSATAAVVTTTPTSTTTYILTGVDANGCAGSDQVTITVNPNPTVNAGTDQTVCAGTPITLTGTGALTYSWSPTITNGVAFTPAATTTYTLTGTTNGCIGSDQVLVTVNPVPTVSAGPDQTLCQGPNVTLTATGASTYTWTPSITNGVAFAPALGATTYSVVGTTNGCTGTDQVVVTINPLPTVNAGADINLCEGTNATLTATGANNYTWTPIITNGTPFTPALGSTTYSVTGTTAAGCTGTDQVVVTLNPNPTPIIQGATTYCVGFPPTLSTNTPFTTYAWSTGVATPTASVTQANNPITVTVTNAFGCSGTSPAFNVTQTTVINTTNTITICQGQSSVIHGITQTVAGVYPQTFPSTQGCDSVSTVTLVVNPLPSVNAGIDQTVCTGTQITLNATGASTYTWSPVVTNGVPFTQAVGTTTYTVTGTSAAGCINTDQVVVTVNPLPTVDAGLDQTICIGQTVTLTGAGANTYSWTAPVQNNVAFSPSATTTYTVTGTSLAGCTNT